MLLTQFNADKQISNNKNKLYEKNFALGKKP